MTTPLDVLVLQSHPRTATDAENALRTAGHRVHQCYDPASTGFPCKGLLEPDGCPLDRGVDVALLARRSVTPRPTTLENGAICAIRAGVPLVEHGPAVLDPFEPWLTLRVEDQQGVVEACVAATTKVFEPLRLEILAQAADALQHAGSSTEGLSCSIERTGRRLVVQLAGPTIDRRMQQVLALRVMSAVQRSGTSANPLDVHYSPIAA